MAKGPNILFIMADDHASKAIGCYGAGINSTPNMDRLAQEGMLFNHCYVTNSICTPSRAAILTGTHNHVNGVFTLDSKINKRLPNVAKALRTSGYQTSMIGKWHLGEGKAHEPTGFDHCWDPEFIEMDGTVTTEYGYCTDIITQKSLDWLKSLKKDKPFFLMCHHKAPHRKWECHPRHKHLYSEDVKVPETFDDDYRNRAKAAAVAKMKVEADLDYTDLGLVQPEGGREVGELHSSIMKSIRKVPSPATDDEVKTMRLIDRDTAEVFTFNSKDELKHFKYQRYMKRYLRSIQSIDDSVGEILDYLDQNDLSQDTIVIYTSDQGFFLGDHGWFDKRFMYEESFQMPFLIRYPREIQAGSICDDVVSNVDFAATWLDYANTRIPSYMQGRSFRSLCAGQTPEDWLQVAYHRYWMHRDLIHEAYAHYGIRNQRYKLIYWYNEGFNLEGTQSGGQDREWELFDCENDQLELFNCYQDPKYVDVVRDMKLQLERLMEDIGDEPVHELEFVGRLDN